jgi:putative glutathione S-transferase
MPSIFRNTILSDRFPAEQGRYVLYVNYCCPWSHRAIIVHGLKGLEDVVQLVEVDSKDPTHKWYFGGRTGPSRDPIYGVRWIKELYLKADPQYVGRITVPLLWDKRTATIVNNESSEIIRMFFASFDQYLPFERREANKGIAAFIPNHLRAQIDTLNAWVYDDVNNGVYKAGFASSQSTYNEHVARVFRGLDRLENHLSQHRNYPYLFGYYITEADIRLYTTLVRFDVVYYPMFRCNLKMIRTGYPLLHNWLRRLYWGNDPSIRSGVFKETTHFNCVSPPD